jgi:hypothetical protein
MDSERWAYFERCVLPGIPKQDRGKMHYGLELEKMALLAQRNQQVSQAKSTSYGQKNSICLNPIMVAAERTIPRKAFQKDVTQRYTFHI